MWENCRGDHKVSKFRYWRTEKLQKNQFYRLLINFFNAFWYRFGATHPINAWNNLHKLLKFLQDIYVLISSKKFFQMSFFQISEINCQLSHFSNFASSISILTFFFSLLLLFYFIHFTVWSFFDILNRLLLLSNQWIATRKSL